MKTVTKLELKVLNAIANSDYSDGNLSTPVWFFSISGCVTSGQMSGVVSSLSKKGLAATFDEGTEDHTIQMTAKGIEAFESILKSISVINEDDNSWIDGELTDIVYIPHTKRS